MKYLRCFFLIFLLLANQLQAAFTEFYAQTTGSNLNGGSSTADAALVTNTNGNWDGSAVFICNGATDLTGVAVGAFASVYNDGASVAVYVARVTNVVDATDTITLSTTAKSGTAPTISATARTIKVGGAWKGPNGTEDFPFGFVQSTMTNTSGDYPRTNFLAGSYVQTGAITHSSSGPMRFQGYTTTPGDGGKATITGATTGSFYVALTISGNDCGLNDFIILNNGATSSTQAGLVMSGIRAQLRRVVVHDVGDWGINISGGNSILLECETYACNTVNTAARGGIAFTGAASGIAIRCISHDNTGSNSSGLISSQPGIQFINCIADSNGASGFRISGTNGSTTLLGCEAYNNTGDGLDMVNSAASLFVISNCNFIDNGGWGITSSGSSIRQGSITNCGFGTGTAANASGNVNTNIGAILETGHIDYAANVTPWVDPANGDFDITLATAKNAGLGTFTQTAASYTGTLGYPDIGAAQHLTPASGGGQTSSGFVK